ncbi:MAG: hypothetical protein HYZ42_16080 [Bacteroidetes bacterium]|nr:hypothetical protein [Bacteroidota bacterium]
MAVATIFLACQSHEQKPDEADEWSLFQLETEKKIEANKATIKAMRELPNAGDKLIKRITKLERDNNALMREMDEYKEDVKVRWENFKLTLNHDVNQIQIELKDLSVKNGR